MKSRYIIFLFIISTSIFISCTCQKQKIDFSVFELNRYYYSKIDENKTLYIEFNSTEPIVKGGFFIYNGKALTEYIPFTVQKRKSNIIIETENKKYRIKNKIKRHDTGFSIVYKKKTLDFTKEEPIAKHRFVNRYKDAIFSKIRDREISFGKAKGYYVSKVVDRVKEDDYGGIILDVSKNLMKSIIPKEHQLDLDLYMPIGDTISKRPLLVLVHGGAFIIGDKKSETMQSIAQYLVHRGFVVASINYRLGYLFLPGSYSLLERSIYRGIQDTRAAIRYLVNYSNLYKIDTDNIFVAGNSAGGFIAMKTAFMKDYNSYSSIKGIPLIQDDLGCLDCSGNQYQNYFSLKGVINMWGGLTDIEIIEAQDSIPILHIHGDADPIIPFDYDYPFANISTEISSFFSRKIYGSNAIHQQMNKLKLPSTLVTLKNSGHDPQLDSQGQLDNYKMEQINQHIHNFMLDILLHDHQPIVIGKNTFQKDDDIATYSIKCKKQYEVNWDIKGGKIIEYSKDRKRVKVVWFNNVSNKHISAVVKNDIGLINNTPKKLIN